MLSSNSFSDWFVLFLDLLYFLFLSNSTEIYLRLSRRFRDIDPTLNPALTRINSSLLLSIINSSKLYESSESPNNAFLSLSSKSPIIFSGDISLYSYKSTNLPTLFKISSSSISSFSHYSFISYNFASNSYYSFFSSAFGINSVLYKNPFCPLIYYFFWSYSDYASSSFFFWETYPASAIVLNVYISSASYFISNKWILYSLILMSIYFNAS